jgi:FtsZ-binding cell division protein ZapB
MSKKPADKAAGKTKAGAGQGSAMMSILQIAGFGAATIAVAVMVAGMHDLGFIDLTHSLEIAVVPMLVLLILAASVHAFANAKIHAAKFTAAEQSVGELRDLLEQRIASVETRIDGHLGAEYEALKTENEALKAQLDEIRKAEDEKIGSEIEQLRQKNTELQEKISTWAVNSVEAAIAEEKRPAA